MSNFADIGGVIADTVEGLLMDDGTYTPKATGVAVPCRMSVEYREVEIDRVISMAYVVEIPAAMLATVTAPTGKPERGDGITAPEGAFQIERLHKRDARFVQLLARLV
jgi:hypothetical protein